MKVQHLRQLSPFVHGVIDRVGWRTLLLLVWLLHLPRLLRHNSHLLITIIGESAELLTPSPTMQILYINIQMAHLMGVVSGNLGLYLCWQCTIYTWGLFLLHLGWGSSGKDSLDAKSPLVRLETGMLRR